MNVIIAGGRDFDDYQTLVEQCDFLLSSLYDSTPISIVCGMARGADSLGKSYAQEKGYEVIEMPANWDEFGKKAGYIRNEEMAKVADVVIAFWDQKSRGTASMINLGYKYKLKVAVVEY